MKRLAFLFTGLLLSTGTGAHHSAYVHFDRNDVVEVSGELVSIDWRNPHTEMVIRAVDDQGEEVLWLGQERAASLLARKNVMPGMIEEGSEIKVAGFRGRRNKSALFVTNILLPDGREIFNESFAEQRWEAELAGTTMAAAQAERMKERPVTEDGLFRIWSTQITEFEDSERNLDRALWNDEYPLTEFAKNVQGNWDPVDDNPFIFCQNGMPAIMDQIQPMEFTQDGGDIVLRLEEQDVVRRIHMSGVADTATAGNPYGYSTGHWDGDTLVVETINIEWGWFDQDGLPQSEDLQTVERFTPTPDGYTLNYQLTATDPQVFTEPVLLERNWIWVPGEEIRPYECEWDGDTL